MFKVLALDNFWAPVSSKHKVVNLRRSSGALRFWSALLMVAISTVLLFSYIYGVNEYANKGYQIKVLQTRLNDLTENNKKINLKISEVTSMVAIQQDFLSSNFVPAGTPKFLEVKQFSQR